VYGRGRAIEMDSVPQSLEIVQLDLANELVVDDLELLKSELALVLLTVFKF